MFNLANTSVAILCNHQKNIKSKSSTIDNLNYKIKLLMKKKKLYNEKKKYDKEKKINIKIKLLKLKKESKIKMKNISLDTSKNNYIDPRIIFAFIKKYKIPIEKILNNNFIKKFHWASNIDENYYF
jgi:DNA topoisomerase-1